MKKRVFKFIKLNYVIKFISNEKKSKKRFIFYFIYVINFICNEKKRFIFYFYK